MSNQKGNENASDHEPESEGELELSDEAESDCDESDDWIFCHSKEDIFKMLSESPIVKQMNFIQPIIDIISDYSHGCIAYCRYCEKEHHISNIDDCIEPQFEEFEVNVHQRKFYPQLPLIICEPCLKKMTCDHCQEVMEDVYECDDCGDKVCCNDNCEEMHLRTHMDLNLGFTEYALRNAGDAYYDEEEYF